MKQTEITSYIFLEKKYIFYILSRTVPFGTSPVSGRGETRGRPGLSDAPAHLLRSGIFPCPQPVGCTAQRFPLSGNRSPLRQQKGVLGTKGGVMSAYGTPGTLATGYGSILTRQEIAFILGMYAKDAEDRERKQSLSSPCSSATKDARGRKPE